MNVSNVMKESTYRVYIAIFFIAIFLFLFFSVITFKQINDLVTVHNDVEHTYEIRNKTQELLSDLINAETGQRGYLLIRDSVFLDPYQQADGKIEGHIQELRTLTKENPEQYKFVRQLETINKWRLQYLTDVLDDYAPNGQITNYSKKKVYLGKSLMDSCRVIIANLEKSAFAKLRSKQQRGDEKVRSASVFALIAMLVSLAIILIAFYKIDYDLNKMRKILKNLNLSNYKLTQAQEVGNMGNWVWNLNDNSLELSDQYYRQIGYKPGEFPATIDKFIELLHPDDKEEMQANLEYMTQGKADKDFMYRLRKRSGDYAYISTKYAFIKDEKGDRKICMGINMDVTEDVEAARGLEMRNEALLKANSELSSFNYIASHDLQEPLRKIQMFISRIDTDENTTISGRSEKFFEKIKDAAQRMQALINDLLAFSRLNKTDKVFEEIDLNETFEIVQEEWIQTIEEKNAALVIADNLPQIKGIPFLIQTLFSNIIGNALKYASNERRPHIQISHQPIGSQKLSFYQGEDYQRFHEIRIEDNGIGFDNEYADRIFELFQRLHDKHTFAGTGIGLAICKKIVEAHGGYIKATGQPNSGATFFIYLPQQ